MNNRKLLSILALLLLTSSAYGQQTVPPSSINQSRMKADANLKAQLQPQPQRQLLPQTQVQPAGKQEEFPPTPVPVKFEGNCRSG